MTERLAQFTNIRAALVVGGLSANVQAAALRTRPEVVVAGACTRPLLSST